MELKFLKECNSLTRKRYSYIELKNSIEPNQQLKLLIFATLNMLKRIAILFLFIPFVASAGRYDNPYNNAIGVRVGTYTGVSYKHFFNSSGAFELIGAYPIQYGKGGALIGLFEYQKEFYRHFNVFLGAGAHIGIYGSNYYNVLLTYKPNNNSNTYYNGYVLSGGFSGVIGIEYVFADLPITAGLDVRPFIDVFNQGPSFVDIGFFTVRYYF